VTDAVPTVLDRTVVDIESHVQAGGWNRPPMLFALVRADRFYADDPVTAARLGLDAMPPDSLAPIEQEELPDRPLDEVLAGIGWPDAVSGCAIAQEIVILPPEAEAEVAAVEYDADAAARAATHPDRREGRLVVGVLRDGSSSAVLRLRDGGDGEPGEDDLLTGPNLAPNMVAALLATLEAPVDAASAGGSDAPA